MLSLQMPLVIKYFRYIGFHYMWFCYIAIFVIKTFLHIGFRSKWLSLQIYFLYIGFHYRRFHYIAIFVIKPLQSTYCRDMWKSPRSAICWFIYLVGCHTVSQEWIGDTAVVRFPVSGHLNTEALNSRIQLSKLFRYPDTQYPDIFLSRNQSIDY